MTNYAQIRADFDRDSIVVYQAYNDSIADAAVSADRLVKPFSFGRMTWIKPSFLWMMERSAWATKSNQTRVLAIRIKRTAWDVALSLGVLTSYTPGIHHSNDRWRDLFSAAQIHVQWDPERSIGGKKMAYRAIQVGIGRTFIEQYASEWITNVADVTPLVKKIRRLKHEGNVRKAKSLLPIERPYIVDQESQRLLGISELTK